jgi:hypothetical protein
VDAVTWRPGRRTAIVINLLALAVFALGLVLFGLPVVLLSRTGGRIVVGFGGLLLLIVFILLLGLGHEAIHGLVMRRYGASPQFGAAMLAKVVPVFYTAAPGHHFSRAQYLVLTAAPCVAISIVGLIFCATPVGAYLFLPLAVHFAGCTGDGAIIWRVLQEPRGTVVEDLIDGLRFHPLGV